MVIIPTLTLSLDGISFRALLRQLVVWVDWRLLSQLRRVRIKAEQGSFEREMWIPVSYH